jgi:DNA gyrase subunit A
VIIAGDTVELTKEDIIPNKASLIVYSKKGYIKRISADAFSVQRLRGTGKAVARLKDDDFLEEVISINDHDCLLFFTTQGRAHSIRAFDVPEGSRTSVGTALAQVR